MKGAAWTVDGLELIPRGAIDEKQVPLLDIVEGRRPVFLYCGAPTDVPRALTVARDNGFLARTTLLISPDCWEAADLIAEAGVPVILSGDMVHTRRDPVTGEELETFVPGVLEEKGVRYALSSRNANTNSLWYQAALAVGHGIERQAALDAVTTVPAEILGLGKDVGSDEDLDKATYPKAIGLEPSRDKARSLVDDGCALLDGLDRDTSMLRDLARFVIDRAN